MMTKTAWMILALVMVVALAAALPAISQQNAAGGNPGGNPGGGQPGMGGGPGMGGPGMGMGGPPSTTMVVTDKGVYVAMGPWIYRFDAETLKLVAKVEIPRPEPPKGVAGAAAGANGPAPNAAAPTAPAG